MNLGEDMECFHCSRRLDSLIPVKNPPWTLVIALLSILSLSSPSFGQESSDLEGHMEAIFSTGVRHDVPILEGFPSPQAFYTDYAIPSKPVLFKNAAKQFPAFEDWSDDYFLRFPESEEAMVIVEQQKKENRTLPAEEISFADFVRTYRQNNTYMVNSVPDFLKEDVLVPQCISCQDIIKGNLVNNILWFSSGGTKSVLHTDSAENILCLIRGNKEFFLVNKTYAEQVNVTERGYSDVDVDRVNMTKYPGLHKLEHYYAAMEAGDCLYVPFLWIHHVRSYNVNIAVNLWWKDDLEVDFNTCANTPVTFEGILFIGFGGLYESQYRAIKNRLAFWIKRHGSLTLASLVAVFDEPDIFGPDAEWTEEMIEIVKQIITKMDKSKQDERVDMQELESLKNEDWEEIRNMFNDLSLILYGDEYQGGEEAEDEESVETAAAEEAEEEKTLQHTEL